MILKILVRLGLGLVSIGLEQLIEEWHLIQVTVTIMLLQMARLHKRQLLKTVIRLTNMLQSITPTALVQLSKCHFNK